MQKTLKKHFLLFVVPTLAAFTLAFLIPFVMGVYLSFCKFRTIANVQFVGFDNYVRIFRDKDFLNAFRFTFLFVIVAVLTVNVFAFLLALLLTRKMRGTNLFRTVFFMPNLIGGIVLGYIWQQMLNAILLYFETTLVAKASYGFWGLVILTNWQMIGYMMIIYIAGLQNVPVDLLEAAQIDGADALTTLFWVKIPMIMPSVTICLFLTVSNSFMTFDQNLALTAGAPGKRTTMLALDIYNTFYGRSGYEGVGQAKAVLFFVVVAVIALGQLVLTRRKEIES